MKKSTIKKSTLRIISIVSLVFLLGVYFGSQYLAPNSSNKPAVNAVSNVQQRVQISTGDDPVLGDKNAPLTIIEFSDFQCPFCRAAYNDVLSSIKKDYIDAGKVKLVYRDFPLPQHPEAMKAAEAGRCANEQDKFWEMHNKIFDEQNKKGVSTISFSDADIKRWASQIGIDTNEFNSCLDSDKYNTQIQQDIKDGEAAGVQGTPSFFIGNPKNNYIFIPGEIPYSLFKQIFDQELAR